MTNTRATVKENQTRNEALMTQLVQDYGVEIAAVLVQASRTMSEFLSNYWGKVEEKANDPETYAQKVTAERTALERLKGVIGERATIEAVRLNGLDSLVASVANSRQIAEQESRAR